MMMQWHALLQSTLALQLGDADIPDELGAFDTGSFFSCRISEVDTLHFPGGIERADEYLPWLTQAIKRVCPMQFHTSSTEIVLALADFTGPYSDLFVAVKAGDSDFVPCSCLGTGRTLPRRMMRWQPLDFFLLPALPTHDHGLEPLLLYLQNISSKSAQAWGSASRLGINPRRLRRAEAHFCQAGASCALKRVDDVLW
jgi:hypothetical protein